MMSQSSSLSSFLMVLLLALAGACPAPPPPGPGEGEGEGEGEGDDDPEELNVLQLAEANAAFALRCQVPGFDAELDPAFHAVVVPNEGQLVEAFRAHLNALAGDPLISVNLGQVNDCLAFLADASSPCPVAGEQPGESCRAIFVGQVPPDGECSRAEECQFGFGCTAGTDQCGVCVQRSGDGFPCDPGGCLAGLACIEEDDVGVCRSSAPPAPVVGDGCVDDADCGQALTTGLVCRASACAALDIVPLGTACDADVFAGVGLRVCADGLTSTRCDDDDGDGIGACAERGGIGDSCAEPDECHGLDAFCDQGLCGATGQLGDACDLEPGGPPNPCTRALFCDVDGTCTDSIFLPPAAPTCG